MHAFNNCAYTWVTVKSLATSRDCLRFVICTSFKMNWIEQHMNGTHIRLLLAGSQHHLVVLHAHKLHFMSQIISILMLQGQLNNCNSDCPISA